MRIYCRPWEFDAISNVDLPFRAQRHSPIRFEFLVHKSNRGRISGPTDLLNFQKIFVFTGKVELMAFVDHRSETDLQ